MGTGATSAFSVLRMLNANLSDFELSVGRFQDLKRQVRGGIIQNNKKGPNKPSGLTRDPFVLRASPPGRSLTFRTGFPGWLRPAGLTTDRASLQLIGTYLSYMPFAQPSQEGCHASVTVRRAAPAGSFLSSHLLSKIMVGTLSGVKAAHFGIPL